MFTHKGWFLLCPIKAADPFGKSPCLAARWSALDWWFDLNEGLQNSMIAFLTLVNPDYEPMWMFRITGELK